MRPFGRTLQGLRPDPSELLSLGERTGYVEAVRVAIAMMVAATVLLATQIVVVPAVTVFSVTGLYLAISTIPQALRKLGRTHLLAAAEAMLLIDGIYLAFVLYGTGGALSPLRFLLFVHVIVATLLVSYRTGLKLAVWHTLLFLVVVQSGAAGILNGGSSLSVADRAVDPNRIAVLTVVALWMITLGTAAFSAINERHLRRQKADLEQLSTMVAEVDSTTHASEIPEILLDSLRSTFGFTRGLVLASPQGDLELMASTGTVTPLGVEAGLDPLMERAWATRETQLVRRLDPETDPRLAALLPDGHNVLVVPLFLNRGYRLGVLVLEHPGAGDGLERWIVSMVGQFASHAALALHNGWLMDERQTQLEEIRSLQRELLAHNTELEIKVADRTQELRDVIRNLEEVDEQRRRLLGHVVQAQEDERRRIANDIHDDPVQRMVTVKMRLEVLRRLEPQLTEIDELKDVVSSSISSLRHMLFDLRPPILDEEGIGPAIRRFLENSDATYGFTVEDELAANPSDQTRLILYRIAQEALTNARKHSQAQHVEVVLKEEDGGILLRIGDDGLGFSPQDAVVAAPGHLGLAAMRERAEMAGGRCQLRSLPGAGTTVEVWMPADEAPSEFEGITADDDETSATILPLRSRAS